MKMDCGCLDSLQDAMRLNGPTPSFAAAGAGDWQGIAGASLVPASLHEEAWSGISQQQQF
jgi:hypothetical protein